MSENTSAENVSKRIAAIRKLMSDLQESFGVLLEHPDSFKCHRDTEAVIDAARYELHQLNLTRHAIGGGR